MFFSPRGRDQLAKLPSFLFSIMVFVLISSPVRVALALFDFTTILRLFIIMSVYSDVIFGGERLSNVLKVFH